ncbi:MAG: WD40 repeat domain-containing protein, partial [Gemmataceae bacterium]
GKKIKDWYWGEEDRVAFSETVFDFSPDGRLIAYNPRPCIRIRDLATFEEVGKIAMGSNPATALAFAPAGKRLASGHRDTTVLIWQLAQFTPKALNARLSSDEREGCWRDLASDDALRAYQAGWKLSGDQEAVAFLSKRLEPARAAQREVVLPLVRDLDSEDARVRASGLEKLEAIGPAARPIIEATLKQQPSLEVRRRLEKLCADWDAHVVTVPESLRQLRAIVVLQRIGSKEAIGVLKTLAGGLKGARETEAAAQSLERFKAH